MYCRKYNRWKNHKIAKRKSYLSQEQTYVFQILKLPTPTNNRFLSLPHLQGIVHRLKAHRRLRQFAPPKVGHHLERPAQRPRRFGRRWWIWLEPPKKSMEIQWEMAGNHKKWKNKIWKWLCCLESGDVLSASSWLLEVSKGTWAQISL